MLSLSTRPCSSVSVAARAERRDLHGLFAEHHVHELEAPADQARAPEDLVHILGIRVGRDVEVLGAQAQQQVAHRAAHDVRLVAVAVQHLADLARALRDRLAADSVLFLRDGSWPGAGAEPEDAPNEFLDQVGRKLRVPAASRGHWYSASRLAWVSISLERPRRARPASYSKTAKPQCRAAWPGSCSAARTVFPPDAHREKARIACAWWRRSRCCSGSSSSRISASCSRACAMRARWRSPPESVR